LPPDQFSFPSGHSITAFAIAICLGMFYPQLLDILMIAAVCIAASRIILGMHFLSDVVAGSAIGASLGYGCFRLFA
jgi:undecaprenyl-diphosphatase